MENKCKVLLGKYSRRGSLLCDRWKKIGMGLKKKNVGNWIGFSWLNSDLIDTRQIQMQMAS